MEKIILSQSRVLKILANKHRLNILSLIAGKEVNAGELVKKTGLSKSNLSQHIDLLLEAKVISSRKEGLKVYYTIIDKAAAKKCPVMEELVVSTLRKNISK